ncbi:MAG: exonuclease domain-containing protein [Catonella sp.]
MLGLRTGDKLDKYVSDYTVFDLETTGVSPQTDKVIEISAIKVRNGQAVDEFSSLVNPMRNIPYGATRVNGITDEMVADKPVFEKVLGDFLDFIEDDILVGHNIHDFDMKFIHRDCEAFFRMFLGNDYVDTLPLARKCLPQIGHHKLTDLALYYKISINGAHRALNDCRMNQLVFERLGAELKNGTTAPKICPRCGGSLKLRNGKFGSFLGCTSYPDCRYTENI